MDSNHAGWGYNPANERSIDYPQRERTYGFGDYQRTGHDEVGR